MHLLLLSCSAVTFEAQPDRDPWGQRWERAGNCPWPCRSCSALESLLGRTPFSDTLFTWGLDEAGVLTVTQHGRVVRINMLDLTYAHKFFPRIMYFCRFTLFLFYLFFFCFSLLSVLNSQSLISKCNNSMVGHMCEDVSFPSRQAFNR